jgi:hypothetical protein
MYLKTETRFLSSPVIRGVVCETIKWCEANLGKKRKRTKLSFRVLTQKKGEWSYGMYNPETNEIIIHRNMCSDIRTIVKVTIHEYTHFLQDLRGYSKVLQKVGYRNHPQEIEARANEYLFSKCFKEIKYKL